jgi:hypothetical protein
MAVPATRPISTLDELRDETRRLYDSITANARREKVKPRRVTVKRKNRARRRS